MILHFVDDLASIECEFPVKILKQEDNGFGGAGDIENASINCNQRTAPHRTATHRLLKRCIVMISNVC